MYKSIGDGFGKIMAAEGLTGFTLVSKLTREERRTDQLWASSPQTHSQTELFT
jgi:hypothetical protein